MRWQFCVFLFGSLLSIFCGGCCGSGPAENPKATTAEMTEEAMAKKDPKLRNDYKRFGRGVSDEQAPFSMSVVENHRDNLMDVQTIISRIQWCQDHGLGDSTENAKLLYSAESLKSRMLGGDGVPGDAD